MGFDFRQRGQYNLRMPDIERVRCLNGSGECPPECPAFEIARNVQKAIAAGESLDTGIFGEATPPGRAIAAADLAREVCIKEVPTAYAPIADLT